MSPPLFAKVEIELNKAISVEMCLFNPLKVRGAQMTLAQIKKKCVLVQII